MKLNQVLDGVHWYLCEEHCLIGLDGCEVGCIRLWRNWNTGQLH